MRLALPRMAGAFLRSGNEWWSSPRIQVDTTRWYAPNESGDADSFLRAEHGVDFFLNLFSLDYTALYPTHDTRTKISQDAIEPREALRVEDALDGQSARPDRCVHEQHLQPEAGPEGAPAAA